MGTWHSRSKRKFTGGLLRDYRKKRKYDLGSEPTRTTIGTKKLKRVKVYGGKIKNKLRFSDVTNVLNLKTKKLQKVKILDVIENKANPHFVRQKNITKGAILKTEIGNVKVTNRPAQDGVINSILLEEIKEEKKVEKVSKPKKKIKKKIEKKKK